MAENKMAPRLPGQEEVDRPCQSCCHVVVKHNVHSYCRDCLQEWWTEKPADECPVCKTSSAAMRDRRPANGPGLKKLCEKLSEEKCPSVSSGSSQAACAERRGKCPSDGQRASLTSCRESERHAGRSFGPADEEASPNCKRETQEASLKPFKEKLGIFEEVKMNYVQAENRMEAQARDTEAQIRDQFKNLHRFLHDEEEARMASLRQEEAEKSREIKQKLESLSRATETLSDAIRDAEGRPRADNHRASFLQSCEAAAGRVQLLALQQQRDPRHLLIDETKHLSNLAFSVWEKMREMVTDAPVTLEPADTTAQPPGLILSDHLTTARHAELQEQRIPENAERSEASRPCTVLQSSENHESYHRRSPGTPRALVLKVRSGAHQGSLRVPT